MKAIPAGRGPMQILPSSEWGVHLKIVIAVMMLWMNAIPRGRGVAIDSPSSSSFQCPSGIFSFGTSLSDTGSGPFAIPGLFSSQNSPYGNTFFGRNALRFSDGRLVLDFLTLAYGFPLLTGYIQSIAAEFRYGVNFAVSAATAIAEAPSVPFHLDVQVAQFSTFKVFAQAVKQNPGIPDHYKQSLPENIIYTKGLYILSFGRNDLTVGYTLDNLTPSEVITTTVPLIVQSIIRGIQNLYEDGARSFLIFNVPPQGCSPQYLTIFGAFATNADYDEYGCLVRYNEVIQVLNHQIHSAVEELRMTLNDAVILHFDYYQAFIAVLNNPQSFGFQNTREACCGGGGQYNFNALLKCSRTAILNNVTVSAESCNNPNEYINWDGIHYTDACNRVIAESVLTGKFLDPPINMKVDCKLDFSKFTGVNFTEAYPDGFLVSPPNLHLERFNFQQYSRAALT